MKILKKYKCVGYDLENCILAFVKFSEDEGKLDEQDLSTIEFSKRLKEATGWRLVGASVLKGGYEAAAREMFSRGVDEARLYVNERENVGDIYSSALLMKGIVEDIGCKAIVFGERSSDTSFGCLGGYVAGLLNMNFISFIKEVVEIKDDSIKVRTLLDGELLLVSDLPAILVPMLELFPPRPVLMRDKLEARKRRPVVVEAGERVAATCFLLRAQKPEEKKRDPVEVKSPEELLNIIMKRVGS